MAKHFQENLWRICICVPWRYWREWSVAYGYPFGRETRAAKICQWRPSQNYLCKGMPRTPIAQQTNKFKKINLFVKNSTKLYFLMVWWIRSVSILSPSTPRHFPGSWQALYSLWTISSCILHYLTTLVSAVQPFLGWILLKITRAISQLYKRFRPLSHGGHFVPGD